MINSSFKKGEIIGEITPGPTARLLLLDGDWGLGVGKNHHLLWIIAARRAGVERSDEAIQQRPGER
jgi:hypothetical protein